MWVLVLRRVLMLKSMLMWVMMGMCKSGRRMGMRM